MSCAIKGISDANSHILMLYKIYKKLFVVKLKYINPNIRCIMFVVQKCTCDKLLAHMRRSLK